MAKIWDKYLFQLRLYKVLKLPIMVSDAPRWIPCFVPLESTKNVAKRHKGIPTPVESVEIRSIFSPTKMWLIFIIQLSGHK